MRTFWIHFLFLLYGIPAVHLVYPYIPPGYFSPFPALLNAWLRFPTHPSIFKFFWLVGYTLWWIPVCYIFGHLVALLFYPLHWVLSQPEYQIKGRNPLQD
jgi:hypothetical protein